MTDIEYSAQSVLSLLQTDGSATGTAANTAAGTVAESGATASASLDTDLVASLPPDARDLALDYAQTWEPPATLLTLVAALREAHGPLLFLLDYEAAALFARGDATAALAVIERRQRRSSTIATQALEARALQKAGILSHALASAEELALAYPRSFTAQNAAAEVIAQQGDAARALTLLGDYLTAHPTDALALLTTARAALAAGNTDLAADLTDRLGSGVPADLGDEHLATLAQLLQAQERQESADAVRLEIQRRRAMHWQRVLAAISPWQSAQQAAQQANQGQLAQTAEELREALFRQLNGPDSIPMTREEKRRVTLEAARHFGFSNLREGQAETIAAVMRDESILTVMPTGAGKSLCYQLPALVRPQASLIISPLIALMKDQVESLPAAARKQATFINSTLTDEEVQERMQGVAQGKYKMVYAAPERLRQREFLRALRAGGLGLFVLDEAHCVSLWGHDFRPDYLFLQEARRELGNPTTLAMTATAPPRVRDEILDYIRDDAGAALVERTDTAATETENANSDPRVLTLDIFRDNLHLSALRFNNEDEKLDAVLNFAEVTEGAGIIYVNTRHKSESLAAALRQRGIQAEAYHAGMETRGAVQDRFMSNRTRIVVATVAFGMGIDKADIRFIVHFHPSRSLAGYYQEVGRAGRDGKPSQGVLFYSNNDWANLRRWARADEFSITFLQRVLSAIAAQLGVSEGVPHEGVSGAVDARRLYQILNTDETTVRVAISLLERADLLHRGFDVAQDVTITLPRKLSAPLAASASDDSEFQDLKRGLALAPGAGAAFKMNQIASFMGWSMDVCEAMLHEWQTLGYLDARFSRRAMYIEVPLLPADSEMRLQRLLGQSQALSSRRIDDMAGYATVEGCRHGYISAHFGSPPRIRCTVCDNCTGIRPAIPAPKAVEHLLPDDADIEPMILDTLISLPRTVGRSGLARILTGHLRAPYTPDKARHHGALKALGDGGVMQYIDDLLETGRLRQYERQGFMVVAPTVSGRAEAEAWLAENPDHNQYGAPPILPEEEGASDGSVPGEEVAEGDRFTGLQKALWLWRRRLAEELGQPAYVVMSNETMLQIAETRPSTLEELAAIAGMGGQRVSRHGEIILDLVRLNPISEADQALLQAQRVVLAENKSNAASKRTDVAAQASPRVERQVYMKMQELRQKLAVEGRGRSTEIASNTVLKEIARLAPTTRVELEAILGFRGSALNNHTDKILETIATIRAKEEAG